MLAAMTSSLPWAQFQHSSVRDLAWLLLSPPMFRGQLGPFPAYRLPQDEAQCLDWLAQIDATLQKDTKAFPEISRQGFRRLGLYCEALLAFYFEHCGHYRQTHHNIRVQGEQQTMGECDFLLADHQGRVSHVELAVKFYLQRAAGEQQWDSYIGPNAIDRLDIKVQRMISHQLALPHLNEAQEPLQRKLESLGLAGRAITSHHWVKGFLFFPHEAAQCWPEYSNPEAPHGTWMRISEFLLWASTQNCRGNFCEKMTWLSGPSVTADTHTLDEIIAQIRTRYERAENEGRLLPGVLLRLQDRELPLMVVDDHWPETRLPSRRI